MFSARKFVVIPVFPLHPLANDVLVSAPRFTPEPKTICDPGQTLAATSPRTLPKTNCRLALLLQMLKKKKKNKYHPLNCELRLSLGRCSLLLHVFTTFLELAVMLERYLPPRKEKLNIQKPMKLNYIWFRGKPRYLNIFLRFLCFYGISIPTVKKRFTVILKKEKKADGALSFSDFLSTSVIPFLSWMSCHVNITLRTSCCLLWISRLAAG